MHDETTIINHIAQAWDQTNLPQTQFAQLLRDEADLYANAPGEARSPRRMVRER